MDFDLSIMVHPGADLDLNTTHEITANPAPTAPQLLTYITDADELTTLNAATFSVDVQAAPVVTTTGCRR